MRRKFEILTGIIFRIVITFFEEKKRPVRVELLPEERGREGRGRGAGGGGVTAGVGAAAAAESVTAACVSPTPPGERMARSPDNARTTGSGSAREGCL